MDNVTTLQDYISTQSAQLDLKTFVINFVVSAVLAYFLGLLYVKYGSSISNRKKFAENFVLLSCTTMLIISIVKSSLALSLGLVGALSIVRFRAAIKEPEELAFLFISISIGLGLGADQRSITLAAFCLLSVFLISRKLTGASSTNQMVNLLISYPQKTNIDQEKIIKIITKNSSSAQLKRLSNLGGTNELSFIVDMNEYQQLTKIKDSLEDLSKKISFTFIDTSEL